MTDCISFSRVNSSHFLLTWACIPSLFSIIDALMERRGWLQGDDQEASPIDAEDDQTKTDRRQCTGQTQLWMHEDCRATRTQSDALQQDQSETIF